MISLCLAEPIERMIAIECIGRYIRRKNDMIWIAAKIAVRSLTDLKLSPNCEFPQLLQGRRSNMDDPNLFFFCSLYTLSAATITVLWQNQWNLKEWSLSFHVFLGSIEGRRENWHLKLQFILKQDTLIAGQALTSSTEL